jgi:hypothetical protein
MLWLLLRRDNTRLKRNYYCCYVTYPLPDDELLLLLEEEVVELVDLGVEEGEEVGLGGGGWRRGGVHGVDTPLELLVVEELAPPLGQALLDLLLQTLPKLHLLPDDLAFFCLSNYEHSLICMCPELTT